MTKNPLMKPELKCQLTQNVSGDCTFGWNSNIQSIDALPPHNIQMHQFKDPHVYLLIVIKSIQNV